MCVCVGGADYIKMVSLVQFYPKDQKLIMWDLTRVLILLPYSAGAQKSDMK